eukprot:783386_1
MASGNSVLSLLLIHLVLILVEANPTLVVLEDQLDPSLIEITDANQRIFIDFYIQCTEVQPLNIFSIHNLDFSLLMLRIYNDSFYIFDHLVNGNIDTGLISNHVYHIHIQQNKLKATNALKSNIYVSIGHYDGTSTVTASTLIYHDPYANTTNPSLSASYDIQIEHRDEYQLYNFTAHTMDLSEAYTLQHFEREYLLQSVPQNIMIEDLSDTNALTQDIHSFHTTFVDDMDHIEDSSHSFEFTRSSRLTIKGQIREFNFDVKYQQHNAEAINENSFLEHSNHSALFSHCEYPIPSQYQYSLETQWTDPECEENMEDSAYVHLCDTPTSYLSKWSDDHDVYTKIFECNALNGVMEDYHWYYSVAQLPFFADAQSADKIQIVVHDYEADAVYSVVSNPDTYPIINLRNNRSLSHPLYYTINQTKTYYFDMNAWNTSASDSVLLSTLNNNLHHKCHTFHAFDRSQLFPDNYYNLNDYFYDNCGLDDDGILSIDFVNQKCNVLNSNNVSIQIYINSGFKHISSESILEGEIDPDSLSNNLHISDTNLYAYGQHDPSRFYRFPDAFYNFSVSSLSIGHKYQITFSFSRNCDNFSIELYHIAGYEALSLQDDNGTFINYTQMIVVRDLLWESSYNDEHQVNNPHHVAFVATASTMDLQFEVNMIGLSELNPTQNDCYIDVTTDDLIGCIGGGDQFNLSCTSISSDMGNECAPFHLVTDAQNFDAANGYCYGKYGTHLLTNVNSEEYVIMTSWMATTGVNKAWLGLKRQLDNLRTWQWTDIDRTLFTENPLYANEDSDNPDTPFMIGTTPFTWKDAQSACLSIYGTHLASIRSASDNDAAQAVIPNDNTCSTRQGGKVAWIGLSDEREDGEFMWSDGTVYNYTNWGENQPDGTISPRYAAMKPDGTWWDRAGVLKYCYICAAPYTDNCRYFDANTSRLTNGNCNTRTLPFFCTNEWKLQFDFQKADWNALPICIEAKLNGFASLSDLSISPVYDTINDTGCLESNVGVLSVEPLFEDSFGCHATQSIKQDPMYEVFFEIYYELDEGVVLYTNTTSMVYPHDVNDLLEYSAHLGIDIEHTLHGVDMDAIAKNDMMIRFQSMGSSYVYYGDLFRYYADDTFTSTIYPFSAVSTEWKDTACVGTIQTRLDSLSFSNMLQNNTIHVESSEGYEWIVPFHNFIDNDRLDQHIYINVSLPQSANFFGDYAASLGTYAVLLPTSFVTTIELTLSLDYWVLNVAATFAHCLSIGYAQLRIYSVYSDTTQRNLLIKQSMLNTKCAERMTFEFRVPSIYFMHDYNINMTQLLLSNETHTFTPFVVEWDDVDYSYRIQPHYVVGNYKSISGMTYDAPYTSDFIPLSDYLITREYRMMFLVIFLFVLSGMFCGFLCVPACDRKTKDQTYKVQICCFKWCRIGQNTKWVIDAKDVHIDAFGHVFDVFVKKKVITTRRNSTVRTRGSLAERRQQFGDKTTLLDKTLSLLPWALLIGLSVAFTLSQFNTGRRVLKQESQSVSFGLFILLISALIISISVWAVIAAIILCKHYGTIQSILYLQKQCCFICCNKHIADKRVSGRIELQKQTSTYHTTSSRKQHVVAVSEEDDEIGTNTLSSRTAQTRQNTIPLGDPSKLAPQESGHWSKAARGHFENKKTAVNKPRRIYKRRKFSMYRHGPFLLSDACCRLMEAFIFTTSFFIAFVAWYSSPEIHAIGTDLPIAIRGLNADAQYKLKIIESWQQNEMDVILWYYNNKSIECRDDMTSNLNDSKALMNQTEVYHNQQMSPSILELREIESWMASRLNTILSSANLAEYAGGVDQVMSEIQDKAQEGMAALNNIKDYADTLSDAICIAMTVPLQLCGGGNCAEVGDGACDALKNMLSTLKTEVDTAMSNYKAIDDAAVSPEVNEAAGQTLKPVQDSGIDASQSTQDLDSGQDVYDPSLNTASTKSANDGKSDVEYEEVSLDKIWSLPIFSLLSLLGMSAIIDTLIIYRKLILILRRVINLKTGLEVTHDYTLDVARVSGTQLHAYNARKYFGYALTVCLIGFPLIYFLYFITYTGQTIDHMFYDVNIIDLLGLYQVWTIPVSARVITANEVLQLNMKSYNEHLLPALQILMSENIETVDNAVSEFNSQQYVKVTTYNQQKCQHQHNIASYGDTMHCFNKYMYPMNVFDDPLNVESCSECFKDVAAMCLVANGLTTKEYVHHTNDSETYNEFNHNPFKSRMAERRKHCHLNEDISWQINDTYTVTINATQTLQASNTLSCPPNMIIHKIHMRGDIANSFIPHNESNVWIGAATNSKYVVMINRNVSWYVAKEKCYSIHSDLASIHSDSDNTQLLNLSHQKTWIGLNDIADEMTYVWNDGADYVYHNWADGQPDHSIHMQWTNNQATEWDSSGAVEDAVYIDPLDGHWYYADGSDEMFASCLNPNTMSISSAQLIHLFDSIQCVQLNRAPLEPCSEFMFDAHLFTQTNHEFVCEMAANASGYGDNAAWFLQGFTFQMSDLDDQKDLSALIALRCCLVSGTVFNNETQPKSVMPLEGPINVMDSNIEITSSNTDDIGIRSVVRGDANSIDGFIFESIKDYVPRNGAQQEGIHFDDYEAFGAQINIDKMQCKEGCDPSFTSECSDQFDLSGKNPFVCQFECDNMNYTRAMKDGYHECEISPIFVAYFYDYDKDKHKDMVIEQLTPYYESCGTFLGKITSIIWIFVAVKILFQIYYWVSQAVADKCCEGVFKRHQVVVKLLEDVTPSKHQLQQQQQGSAPELIKKQSFILRAGTFGVAGHSVLNRLQLSTRSFNTLGDTEQPERIAESHGDNDEDEYEYYDDDEYEYYEEEDKKEDHETAQTEEGSDASIDINMSI